MSYRLGFLRHTKFFLNIERQTFFPLKLTNLPHQATWPWKAVDHQIYKCPLSQSRNLHRIFLDLCLLWVCPYKHHHEFVYNLYWKINSYLHKYLHIFIHFFKPFKIIQAITRDRAITSFTLSIVRKLHSIKILNLDHSNEYVRQEFRHKYRV